MNELIKNLGLIICLIGATCTSLDITPINVYLLNVGALLYLIWSIRVRDYNLICVNAGMLIIYGFGTIYRLLGY